MDLTSSSRRLKALADETRLRILHLLSLGELSVTDLVEILNMGQSRISTQLTLLREVGLVRERRTGRRHYYSLQAGPAIELFDQIQEEIRQTPELHADAAEFEAWRERQKGAARSYFDRVAASFGEVNLPGRTWEGLARALLQLAPRGRYVDLGIGDGLLTMMLAEVAEEVTAVDVSPKMLDVAMTRAKRLGLQNLVPVEGRLDDLPLDDGEFDVAVLSQALHHAEQPARALSEARRILVPGGRLLLLDLLAHGEEWVREKFHHLHLGFAEPELRSLLEEAGFEDITIQRAARDPEPPHFITLIAVGSTASLDGLYTLHEGPAKRASRSGRAPSCPKKRPASQPGETA